MCELFASKAKMLFSNQYDTFLLFRTFTDNRQEIKLKTTNSLKLDIGPDQVLVTSKSCGVEIISSKDFYIFKAFSICVLDSMNLLPIDIDHVEYL